MTIKSIDGDNALCNWFIGTEVKEAEFPLADLTEVTPDQVKAMELAKFEEALKARAQELSDANGGRMVIPVWYLDPVDAEKGKPVIGFLLEPNRATKGNIMDILEVSKSRAASIALQASVMKNIPEYDARILSADFHYDSINAKAGLEALDLIRLAVSQFKKK